MIGFTEELVPLVKSGEKILTYRVGDKYDYLKPGDHITAKDSSTNKAFAELEVISTESATFGEMSINRAGHEPYGSREEMKKTFEKYYKSEMTDETPVVVFKFKVARIF